MRRAAALAITAILPAVAYGCSLFVSLDDLQNGSDASTAGDVAEDTAVFDGASDAKSPNDSGTDGGPAILSCNAPGLVAYWPMDEGTGTSIEDCASHIAGVFGTANVSWGTRNGKSNLEFSADGYVTFGQPDALKVTGEFTLAGWIRSDVTPSGGYASILWNFTQPSGSIGYEVTLAYYHQFYGQVGTGGDAIDVQMAEPTVWEHVAVVFVPGVRFEAYVNGVSVSVTTTDEDGGPLPEAGAAPGNTDFRMGLVNGDSWTGGIDDVRLFNRALTPEEIATLAAN